MDYAILLSGHGENHHGGEDNPRNTAQRMLVERGTSSEVVRHAHSPLERCSEVLSVTCWLRAAATGAHNPRHSTTMTASAVPRSLALAQHLFRHLF